LPLEPPCGADESGLAAAVALVPGFAGTRWGVQAALAAIATLAITVLLIERQLESRKA